MGLARRLIDSGDPAARFAMRSAAVSALAIPLDLAMLPLERATDRPVVARNNALNACAHLVAEALASEPLARLGPERFRVVRHEDICHDPRGYVERIGLDFLGANPDFAATDPGLGPFAIRDRAGDGETRARIQEIFIRLGAGIESPSPGNFRPAESG